MIARTNRSVLILSALAFVLLLATSLGSIILDDGGDPYTFTSLRGEPVEIYGGEGLYRFDTTFKAVLFRGFDWANLFVALPLLVWGTYLYARGRLRGRLLVVSVFSYLAYNYLIGALGNAFNVMFLNWTALFSVGLFGVALVLAEMDVPSLSEKLGAGFPRRSLSIYVIALGLFLLFQYLAEILTAYGSETPPASLDVYTTLELAALELGIMIPLHLVAGVLVWRRKAVGYVMAIVLSFTALMTFIALSVAALILYFAYGQGGVADVAIPIVLTLIAGTTSVIAFARAKDDAGSVAAGSGAFKR